MEEKIFCTVCGAEMQPEQAFCPKCGISRAVAEKLVCGKCGAALQSGQEFCSVCGQKAGLLAQQAPAKKKVPIAIVIIAVVLVVVAIAGYFLLPKLLITVEDLCAEGRYVEAYEKAEEKEQDAVRAECAVAVISQEISDSLKNKDSFVLRDVYYKDISTSPALVLQVSGTNGFGGVVNSYWYYSWDTDTETWKNFGTVNDLEDEEVDQSDDVSEKLTVVLENLTRDMIRNVLADGIQMEKDTIEHINDLFEADLLDNIDALDFADLLKTEE